MGERRHQEGNFPGKRYKVDQPANFFTCLDMHRSTYETDQGFPLIILVGGGN